MTRIVAFWPFLELVTGAAGRLKWRQGLRLGAHLPHAPGVRMTVVTQTPSNHLMLAFKILACLVNLKVAFGHLFYDEPREWAGLL